jgi:glycosyltransferase involved in cell wall biosynthesis
MRSLLVADEFPWPADNGYRMRLDHVIRGLAAAGGVDLLAVLDRPDRPTVPADAPVERVALLHLPPSRRSVGGYLRWVTSRAPRTVAARPWGTVRDAIAASIAEWSPDVVWWSHADVFGQTGAAVTRPAIVDLDNLEDRKLRDRRRAQHHDLRAAGDRASAGVLVRDALDRVDERRWRRHQRAILHRADVTVVCSELDRARLDSHDVVIVPNAYDPPAGDIPGTRAPDPATFTLIGLFTYEPNLDAARHLVHAVLPRLLEGLPDAHVRLVGRHDGALDDLAGRHVTVTGPVGSVDDELRRATAVVVPMRFGGGTRLKVLEAFASGVPVVSTPLGAEGLGAADGCELLLADTAAALAAACIDVVRRPDETAARVRRAQRLWADRFSGAQVHTEIAQVARRAAGLDPTRARR